MADSATADAPPVGSPAPSSLVDPAPDASPVEDAAALAVRLEATEKELRKVRRENQNLRQRPDPPAEPSVPVTDPEADKTRRALERAEAEREAATAALRAERLSRLAEREAAGAHAVYPDIIAALLEKDLEFEDGSDRPTNLNTLLGALRRKYPLLFHTPSGDGGAGAQALPGTPMNQLIRQMAGRR